jgi:UDP-N-acetylmuramyl pentapeptide synthase
MLYLLSKIIFLIKKPKTIIISGSFKDASFESICWSLDYCDFKIVKISHIKFGKTLIKAAMSSLLINKVIVIKSEGKNLKSLSWMIKKSRLPILIIGETKKEEIEKISDVLNYLPSSGCLALNSDDEKLEIFSKNEKSKVVTFGFEKEADFKVTNVNLTDFPSLGTNFKFNFKGMIVPVWLDGLFGKEEVYSSLSSIVVGFFLNFNLIKISESLRSYRGVEGKMRLIKGVKKTHILDNSDPSSIDSVMESIDIAKDIPLEGRKIIVLGNLKGEENLIEIYEKIAKKVCSVADLLIVFGSGAKIISEEAVKMGMNIEKIFNFDTIEQGKMEVQHLIKRNDLVLISGAKEMKMVEIVNEIKKM